MSKKHIREVAPSIIPTPLSDKISEVVPCILVSSGEVENVGYRREDMEYSMLDLCGMKATNKPPFCQGLEASGIIGSEAHFLMEKKNNQLVFWVNYNGYIIDFFSKQGGFLCVFLPPFLPIGKQTTAVNLSLWYFSYFLKNFLKSIKIKFKFN